MALPYTYLLGWSAHNKFYYGVRFSSNCHPSELWVTYFTSSKHVKKFYDKFGPPNIIKIRKIFTTSEKARLWETKVLKRMNVVNNEMWLNKTDNIAIDPKCALIGSLNNKGVKKSISHRENIKKANIGKILSEEHKKNISDGHKNRTNIEKAETSIKKSIAMKGKMVGDKNPMYGKRGKEHPSFGTTHISGMKGKVHTDASKELMRVKKIGKKQSLEHIAKRLESIKRNKMEIK